MKWIVSKAGLDCFRATDDDGRTAAVYACKSGQLDMLKYLVDQLGPSCLCAIDSCEATPVFHAIMSGHLHEWATYVYDEQGAAALRATEARGNTTLQLLERQAEHDAAKNPSMPIAVAYLKTMLVIPDEQPATLAAEKRLAFAKARHERTGVGSPLVELVERELVQTVATESGLRAERESCSQTLRWFRKDKKMFPWRL